MPLNPPSCHMDTYYSPNVFANKVPVALWRPPAGAFNDGSPASGNIGGQTLFNSNDDGKAAYDQGLLVEQGDQSKSDDTDGTGNDTVIGGGGGTGGLSPDKNSQPAIQVKPGQYELGKEELPMTFPNITDPIYKKRISKYFTLASIRMVPEAGRGLSARDIAANFIDNCQQILDPARSVFNFQVTPHGGFRSHAYNVSKGRTYFSDHELGAAADISTGSRGTNKQLFIWFLKSGLQYYQIIWEGNWVHISYIRGRRKDNSNIMIIPTGSKSGGVYRFHNDPNGAIQKAASLN